jgi:hypothetical protein
LFSLEWLWLGLQEVLKWMSSISYAVRVKLSCSEDMVGWRLYWQRSYHSALMLSFIIRKANSMRHPMLALSQYISMNGPLREQDYNSCTPVQNSFAPKHQYCIQAKNSWAQVAIHVQKKPAIRVRQVVTRSHKFSVFFYVTLNGFRISRWIFFLLCR